jgi:hypothetical protein
MPPLPPGSAAPGRKNVLDLFNTLLKTCFKIVIFLLESAVWLVWMQEMLFHRDKIENFTGLRDFGWSGGNALLLKFNVPK